MDEALLMFHIITCCQYVKNVDACVHSFGAGTHSCVIAIFQSLALSHAPETGCTAGV